MTKPTTYHRYEPSCVARPGSPTANSRRVAVVDPAPDSADMERLDWLLRDEGVLSGVNAKLIRALTRYAAGEPAPAESYCLLDKDGDWWVSEDGERFCEAPHKGVRAHFWLSEVVDYWGIDPGVVVFQPGQRVRSKTSGELYVIGHAGSSIDLTNHQGFGPGDDPFTSEDYELVDGES